VRLYYVSTDDTEGFDRFAVLFDVALKELRFVPSSVMSECTVGFRAECNEILELNVKTSFEVLLCFNQFSVGTVYIPED
jgi:hypothetical protein